jgi:hypothetical protein
LQADALPSPSYVQQLLSSPLLSPLRTAIVDWMSSTAQQLALSSDGLFLAVQLLDRHLAQAGVQLGNPHTQLAAVAALWAASKYEAAQVAPPALITRLAASLGASPADLQAAEARLLADVGHRLSLPTPKTFLRRALARVLLSRRLYFTAGYLAELALLDPAMLLHPPSVAAAAAYLWALVLNSHTCSDAHLRRVTGYGLDQVADAAARLAQLHHAACSTSEPCLIALKYLAPALGCTAALRAVPLDQVRPVLALLAAAPPPPPCAASAVGVAPAPAAPQPPLGPSSCAATSQCGHGAWGVTGEGCGGAAGGGPAPGVCPVQPGMAMA